MLYLPLRCSQCSLRFSIASCTTNTWVLREGCSIRTRQLPLCHAWGMPIFCCSQAVRLCVSCFVPQVMLALTYLKSYSDVGKAKVECVSGCSCKAKVFDAKNSRPTSELHTERMEVSHECDASSISCMLLVGPGRIKAQRSRPD